MAKRDTAVGGLHPAGVMTQRAGGIHRRALGAVVAIPLPFIGPIIGAAAGAGYGYVRGKNKA